MQREHIRVRDIKFDVHTTDYSVFKKKLLVDDMLKTSQGFAYLVYFLVTVLAHLIGSGIKNN